MNEEIRIYILWFMYLFDWSIFIDQSMLCIRAICHFSRLSHGNICHWPYIVHIDEKKFAVAELFTFIYYITIKKADRQRPWIMKCSFLGDSTLASSEAEIISTQDEIITYVNHTAKLSCIIQNKNRHHVRQRHFHWNKKKKLNYLGHMVSCYISEWNTKINQSSVRWSIKIYAI
jgi:hypothetical protein